MNNWPHQDRTLDRIDALLEQGFRDPAIAIPTGGGKSRITFQHMTKDSAKTALYVDRRMLLSQHGANLEAMGVRFGYRAAGHGPRLLDDVQVAMIQTEVSRVLKGDREIHPADRVYVDEAHKNTGDGMQGLRAKHREVKPDSAFLWWTATPLGLEGTCDSLIVGATNSELRECGALVPAYHYGPDEPDTKWVGKVVVDEGECGIAQGKRLEFAQRVFGSVMEHYATLNPDDLPTIGFAPDVESGIWLAEECNHLGIRAAFISGDKIWIDGELRDNSEELRDYIAAEHKAGSIKIVWNRFVLREGIDWPWACHGIFATVFGSLTSYLQAGGRLLRAYTGKDRCTIQDHGGNWWRHGSINEDRHWELGDTDRTVAGVRAERIREKKEPEPITCPKCHAIRISGSKCFQCGFEYTRKSRMVLQKDGSLREMSGDIFRQRRLLTASEMVLEEWCGRVKAIRQSKKPTVQRMTFAQLEATFARDHNWQYAPRSLPMMPVRESDWYRPVAQVQELTR